MSWDDVMPGVPDDVARDILDDAVPGGVGGQERQTGCYGCGSENLQVFAEIAFVCDAVITEITDHDEGMFMAAERPELKHVEFVVADCWNCPESYSWDIGVEKGLEIAHGVDDPPVPPENPTTTPCPECGATDWEGRVTDRFLIEGAELRREDGAFRIEDFTSVGWGFQDRGYSICKCRDCGKSSRMCTNGQLTGWWVAKHCELQEPA